MVVGSVFLEQKISPAAVIGVVIPVALAIADIEVMPATGPVINGDIAGQQGVCGANYFVGDGPVDLRVRSAQPLLD